MSRKHFIKIAQALGKITDQHSRQQAAEAVADALQECNELFDFKRFMAAVEQAAKEQQP